MFILYIFFCRCCFCVFFQFVTISKRSISYVYFCALCTNFTKQLKTECLFIFVTWIWNANVVILRIHKTNDFGVVNILLPQKPFIKRRILIYKERAHFGTDETKWRGVEYTIDLTTIPFKTLNIVYLKPARWRLLNSNLMNSNRGYVD